jgi:hypothetical protein
LKRPAVPGLAALVSVELSRRAARAVERDEGRLVVRQVGRPAVLIGRQPRSLALHALRDDRDLSALTVAKPKNFVQK